MWAHRHRIAYLYLEKACMDGWYTFPWFRSLGGFSFDFKPAVTHRLHVDGPSVLKFGQEELCIRGAILTAINPSRGCSLSLGGWKGYETVEGTQEQLRLETGKPVSALPCSFSQKLMCLCTWFPSAFPSYYAFRFMPFLPSQFVSLSKFNLCLKLTILNFSLLLLPFC